MTSVTVKRRPLLAVALLIGLFLMHGLQTFCNDSSAGGHEMGKPAAGAAMAAPAAGHSDSMTPMGSGREPVTGVTSRSADMGGGGVMLDLCVAILAAGALLAALRRRLPQAVARLAANTLRARRPDWTRLCRWPPGRTLSILCVMRT
jgi:hypothetical protein